MMPHLHRPALLAATATCLLAAAVWLAAADDVALALPCAIGAGAGAGETTVEAGAPPAARTLAFAPAVGEVEASTARSIDAAEAALARELRGIGIASVLAGLRDLVAAGSTDVEPAGVRRRFVWLLRNDPAALPELEALLADPALPFPPFADVTLPVVLF